MNFITIDRVLVASTSLIMLYATTQRLDGDIPALIAFLAIMAVIVFIEEVLE